MEDAYKAGKACAIGVSNFHMDHVMGLVTCHGIVPVVNQIETHLLY